MKKTFTEHKAGRLLALALTLALCLAFAAIPALAAQEEPAREEMSAADIYEQSVNAVVGVTTRTTTTNYWGYETPAAVAGTGFFISDDGYVLTNYHVVENPESITITCYNGDTYDAELIGYDQSDDMAVLKVDGDDLPYLTLDGSGDLRVGDEVVAIGNPLGELTFSLTHGMVSALDREVTTSTGVRMTLIQTDCAINNGNSGGPLFNMYGEVVGITNGKFTGSAIDNVGFAVPISDIAGSVESIIEKGYIAKPYIGVTISDVSADALSYGLPQGAAVKDVTKDGPADKAGIQVNDIVTAVNGEEITGRHDLSQTVGAAQVGEELTLTVYRQGETLDVTVTVEEKTESALPQENAEDTNDAANESEDPLDPNGDQTDRPDNGNDPDQDMYDLFDEFMRRYGSGRGA